MYFPFIVFQLATLYESVPIADSAEIPRETAHTHLTVVRSVKYTACP